jgi:flagellar hook-associated protein 2
MPTINSTGIGSGLNVGALVSQLVAAERAPASGRLLRAEAGANAKISALASFRGALAGLQTAASSLKNGAVLSSKVATSSNESKFTLTANAQAAAGSFEIEVVSLASSHRLRSAAFNAAQSVGTGVLSISVGATQIDVNIDIDHSTLSDIRDAINLTAQASGLAAQATLVNADDGQHLVLSASRTGLSGAIRVTQSGGNSGLSALVFDPGVLTNLDEIQRATDASVRIDGLLRSSSSNQISDALAGVTLQLRQADPGQRYTANVSRDDASAKKSIQSLVGNYNALVAAMATVTRYDPARREAAALNGDSMVRGAASELRALISDATGSGDGISVSLVDIGIDSQVDGTLKLDSARLEAAIASKHSALVDLFASSGGLSAKLDAAVERLIGDSGTLTLRNQAMAQRVDRLADDRVTLDARMSRIEARYLAQFTALDSMISKLQGTSSFLTQQLSSLPGAAR